MVFLFVAEEFTWSRKAFCRDKNDDVLTHALLNVLHGFRL